MFDSKSWINGIIADKKRKSMPILTFPGIAKLGINVRTLVNSSDLMAKTMKAVADATPSVASLAFMDLSVEAEAFGAHAVFKDNEIPTIDNAIVTSEEEADALAIPEVGAGRTSLALETVKKAKEIIKDRPVFAGAIGPYSLTGRLVGVTDALINCYEEPDMMAAVLEKATEFLTKYIIALKEAGADGVVLAEPLAGLLSPDLSNEFSDPYVKKIVEAVQDDSFIVIYHNCGGSVVRNIDGILSIGAKVLHFGNAIDLSAIADKIPGDVIFSGNINPAGEFADGSEESIYQATTDLLYKCRKYNNFLLSSGCDVPPNAKWANIDSFFKALEDYNQGK